MKRLYRESNPGGADVTEELVRLHSGPGPADGCLAYPASGPATWAALIAGPHPYMAGESRNNVVSALLAGFASGGAAALTFDYRRPKAAEQSVEAWARDVSAFWETSLAPHEPEWAGNAKTALVALRGMGGDLPLVLAGYSFGCWAVAQIAAPAKPQAVILVSPSPAHHDWTALGDRGCPLLVIHSDNDFACSVPAMEQWYGQLSEPKEHFLLAAGEHFFRGCEHQVVDAALAFLARHGLCEAHQ